MRSRSRWEAARTSSRPSDPWVVTRRRLCRACRRGRNGAPPRRDGAPLRYTRPMRARRHQTLLTVVLTALLGGCSVISVDLSPRIRPLTEETVEGRGAAKILLMDISGMLSDEGTTPILSLGTPPPRVP